MELKTGVGVSEGPSSARLSSFISLMLMFQIQKQYTELAPTYLSCSPPKARRNDTSYRQLSQCGIIAPRALVLLESLSEQQTVKGAKPKTPGIITYLRVLFL